MIFKIVARSDWERACRDGLYRGSPDDMRDGFIHFSAPDQVIGTAAKHFRGQADLLLVAFDEKEFGEALKWEKSRGGALFPHLYGTVSTKLAVWEKSLALGEDGVPEIPELIAS